MRRAFYVFIDGIAISQMNATVALWLDGSTFHLHVFTCFRPLGCDSSIAKDAILRLLWFVSDVSHSI